MVLFHAHLFFLISLISLVASLDSAFPANNTSTSNLSANPITLTCNIQSTESTTAPFATDCLLALQAFKPRFGLSTAKKHIFLPHEISYGHGSCTLRMSIQGGWDEVVGLDLYLSAMQLLGVCANGGPAQRVAGRLGGLGVDGKVELAFEKRIGGVERDDNAMDTVTAV